MSKQAALTVGILCHLLFVVAVALMAYSLYYGMQLGWGQLAGGSAVVANLFLVLHFPLLHSLLLSSNGKTLLRWMLPASVSAQMSTTSFAICASLQVIAVFALWSPTGIVLWQATGVWHQVFTIAYGLSWLLLAKSMTDAGLGVQTGYLGWLSVYRNKEPRYPSFSRHGSFKYCRQPMYFAYTLILWTSPCLTLDRLMVSVVWTIYCYLGPRLKEYRYLKLYGEPFRQYQFEVGYWLPRRRHSASPGQTL